MSKSNDPDHRLALLLQHQLDSEYARAEYSRAEQPPSTAHINNAAEEYLNSSKGVIDPNWELVDPTPNIVNLFVAFNEKYFWGKLLTVCVQWSKRMTSCAGICSYERVGGMCKIALSEPLLKLRPRKDLVETLLHEMIHAYLFVTDNNRDRDGHGPEFHKHMGRINALAGTSISVFHTFHDEVRLYQQHWWRCDGPCQKRRPFYGMVRRSVNRAPGPSDRWHAEHESSCGGKFVKVKEPEKTTSSKEKNSGQNVHPNPNMGDIRKYINSTPSTSNLTKNGNTNNGINKINGFHNLPTLDNRSPSRNNNTNKNNNNPTKGNILGFNDLKKPGGNTGIRNSSSTIVVTNTNYNNNNNNTATNIAPINGISATKSPKPNVSAASSNTRTTDNVNYDQVRNYWTNKYPTSQGQKRPSNEINSSETGSSPKIPKVTVINEVQCPVCSKSFTVNEIHSHIDECLATYKDTENCENCGESNVHLETHKGVCPELVLKGKPSYEKCPICGKQFRLQELEKHVMTCIENKETDEISVVELKQCDICTRHFEIDEYILHVKKCVVINLTDSFSDHFEYVRCDDCGESMDSDEFENNHKNVCDKKGKPIKHCYICSKEFEEGPFEEHITSCVDGMFADISINRNNAPSVEDSTTQVDEIVLSCLVCNKNIEKAKLEQHLEECLSKTMDVTNLEEENTDDTSPNSENDPNEGQNCPVCLKLIIDEDMNLHLDECLQGN